MKVMNNVINKATKIDWANKTDAFSLSFLPRVFEMTNSQPIIVSPYPIFSDRNDCGKNILVLCDPETEGMVVIDYNQLMKMEYIQ